jgi:DNA polymerase-3 subunit gamma/tau
MSAAQPMPTAADPAAPAEPVTPHRALYRKFRAQRFAELIGQDPIVTTLRHAVTGNRLAHAYLFVGPRGTGKTSTARILAKALNCESPQDGEPDCTCSSCQSVEAGTSLDVVELDAASNRGIEDAREIIRGAALASGGRWRVYILDEVHQLTPAASSALLKTLEEPPANVVFVLATTDPQKVLPTIRSRTQHFDFRLVAATTLAEHLRAVADDAGLDVPDGALDLAVRRGAGSVRDALSALDQIVAAGGEVDDDDAVDEIVEALCDRDTGRALTAVARSAAQGRDARPLAEDLLGALRDALLAVLAPDSVSLPDADLERVGEQGRRLGPPATVRALDLLGEALLAMREAPDPRVVLEVALVRATRPELDASPAALLERIEKLERAGRDGRPPGPPPGRPPREDPPRGPAPEPTRAAAPAGDRETIGSIRQRKGATPSAPEPAPPPPASPPAEPPSAIEAAPEPPPPSGDLPSREELTLLWADQVLGRLRPRAKGLFAQGRFVRVDAAAVLALPSEALRRKADELRPQVEAELSAVAGRRVPLRLVVEGDDSPSPAAAAADEEEVVDLRELADAPPEHGIDRLASAFPGAEIVIQGEG